MNDSESIDDMITSFTKIINVLVSLGDSINNDQKVRKVIRALPPTWKVKSTTLKELNDKEELEFIGLINNLKTHEKERKQEKRRHRKKEDTCLQVYSTHLQ